MLQWRRLRPGHGKSHSRFPQPSNNWAVPAAFSSRPGVRSGAASERLFFPCHPSLLATAKFSHVSCAPRGGSPSKSNGGINPFCADVRSCTYPSSPRSNRCCCTFSYSRLVIRRLISGNSAARPQGTYLSLIHIYLLPDFLKIWIDPI